MHSQDSENQPRYRKGSETHKSMIDIFRAIASGLTNTWTSDGN